MGRLLTTVALSDISNHINQFRYIYPVFFMAASYDLGDMLHKTAQEALSEAASETRLLFEQGSIR